MCFPDPEIPSAPPRCLQSIIPVHSKRRVPLESMVPAQGKPALPTTRQFEDLGIFQGHPCFPSTPTKGNIGLGPTPMRPRRWSSPVLSVFLFTRGTPPAGLNLSPAATPPRLCGRWLLEVLEEAAGKRMGLFKPPCLERGREPRPMRLRAAIPTWLTWANPGLPGGGSPAFARPDSSMMMTPLLQGTAARCAGAPHRMSWWKAVHFSDCTSIRGLWAGARSRQSL